MLQGISRVNVWFSGAFLVIFLWFFAIYDVRFRGPDEPIYFAYTASLVEDGDLNVINNLYPHYSSSNKIGVSSTYNFPDFHNYGGVIARAPFYAYAKGAYNIFKQLNLPVTKQYPINKSIACTLSLSTLIFGFSTLLLTYILSRLFFSNSVAFFSTLAVFFGTPFFYYVLFEPANANILASLFSILSLWFCIHAVKMKKYHWFFYGVFFSICLAIKVDLWFQAVFILMTFLFLAINKRISWSLGVYFMLGLIPGVLLKTSNDYIKYGIFHIGELGLFNGRDYFLLEQLFSSYRGYLYTSPILYICFLSFLLLSLNILKQIKNKEFWKEEADIFLLILSLYVIIKIIFLGCGYAWGGGSVGARPLLTEFPVFVLLLARFFKSKNKFLKYIFFTFSILFITWNLIIISEYIAGVDLRYMVEPPALSARIKMLGYILPFLSIPKDLNLKLVYSFPVIFAVIGAAGYIFSRSIKMSYFSPWGSVRQIDTRPLSFLMAITVYALSAFCIVTVLNAYNNPREVVRLKAEGLSGMVTLINPRDFERSENIGSMNEMIAYFQAKGDTFRVNKIKIYKNRLYGETDYGR